MQKKYRYLFLKCFLLYWEGKEFYQNTVTGVGENGNKSLADNVDTGQNSERTKVIKKIIE